MIVWRESAELLRRCLLALAEQGADQLVVSRSSEADFSESLRSEFPHVQWVEQTGAPELPELQWAALAEVQSDVAAFLEAPSIPGSGWVAAHRQAHLTYPDILACGGSVRPPQTASGWGLGWYWSDFAAYTPGRTSGLTRDLTDANVSYKTRELRCEESRLAEAAWGWRIRKASHLLSYYESSAWIDYPCPYAAGTALGQRWSAGRAHGALQRRSFATRVFSAASVPLLPIALAWRGRQQARGTNYLHSLGWILVFHLCWSCGEATGILTGRR